MKDGAARRQQRLSNLEGIQLNDRTYNLVIGCVLIIGFIVNAFTAVALKDYVLSLNPFILLIGYLVLSMISSIVLVKTKSVAVSFTGFLVLSFATGLVLTWFIQCFSQQSISSAFIGTALILAIMVFAATLNPGFFLSIGRTLCISLLIAIVVDVIFSSMTKR